MTNDTQVTTVDASPSDLSGEVKEQLSSLLVEIRQLKGTGYRVAHLLKTIQEATTPLTGTQVLSEFDLISIENEIAMARRSVKFSTSRKPLGLSTYHLGWIVVWVFAVIYRVRIYTVFGNSDLMHTAIVGVISGAIGASLYSLGALYTHRIRLDLNDSFNLWYILKPVVGGLMGGFVGILAGIIVSGIGVKGPSPATIILSAFGGMHEAWAMGLVQKYTGKVLGSNNPSVQATQNARS